MPDIDTERYCQLEPSAMRAYKALENDLFVEIEAGRVTPGNALVRLLRLQQITSGSVTTDSGQSERLSTAKKDLLSDTLEDIDGPVVVFCRFVTDLDRVREVAEATGRHYGELSGRRRDLTDDGYMPDDVDLMGVQIQAGGLGVDFTRASTAIYYSVGFNLGDLLQARGRLHRPGQTRPVTHIHLLAEHTIDQDAYWALRKRSDLVEGVLRRAQRRIA